MELYQFVQKCVPNLPTQAVRRPVHHYLTHHVGHIAHRSFHHIVAHAPTIFGQTCRYVPIALGIGAGALVPPIAVPGAFAPVPGAFAPVPVAYAPADSGAGGPGLLPYGGGLLAGGGFFASPAAPDTESTTDSAASLGDTADVGGYKPAGDIAPRMDTSGSGQPGGGNAGVPSYSFPTSATGLSGETHGGTKPHDSGRPTPTVQSVPEPSGLVPLAAGLAVLGMLIYRRPLTGLLRTTRSRLPHGDHP